ncbi:MAG: hypothetical protein AMXMBFR22_20820 [Phycisphaerae bacterium]
MALLDKETNSAVHLDADSSPAWSSIAFAADAGEAERYVRLLSQSGIEAQIAVEWTEGATRTTQPSSLVEILVPQEFEMQASELLAGRVSELAGDLEPIAAGDEEEDFDFEEEEDDDFDDDEDDDFEDEDFDDFDDDDDEEDLGDDDEEDL